MFQEKFQFFLKKQGRLPHCCQHLATPNGTFMHVLLCGGVSMKLHISLNVARFAHIVSWEGLKCVQDLRDNYTIGH